ncbi:MAG: ankyrin repeat domain-containing protein [bacterium]
MTKTIKTILTVGTMLMVNQFSFAGATEDLWIALKAANDVDALKAIAAGADLSNIDATQSQPLSLAACFSGAEVITALINAKANINYVQPTNGNSPLMNAATWGNTDAVKLLLAAGANTKFKSKIGQTLLSLGVGSVKLEIVKMLVESGCDPKETFNIPPSEESWTVMISLIASYPPKDKAENIKKIGENIDKAGLTYPSRLINVKESDFTPLGDIAKYLLEQGADPNVKSGGWGCILNQAIAFNHPDIALVLVNAKANLTEKTSVQGEVSGFSAPSLMLASIKGMNAVVEAMCKAGADINYTAEEQKSEGSNNGSYVTITTTRKYNTALSLAVDEGHNDTAEILKKYGATMPE